jgi:hypothetical protein
MDFLGITDAVAKTEAETNKQVEARVSLTKQDAEAARVAMAIKQLQLDIEENIVPALAEQVRLMATKNQYGEAAFETEKAVGEAAKKYNISLEQARNLIASKVAGLNQELILQNKINSAVNAGLSEIDSPSGYDLGGAMKAEKDLALSRASNNQTAILGNQVRLAKELSAYAAKVNEEYGIRSEYEKKISVLDDYRNMLLRNGYSQDSEQYKAYLYAKETAFAEHITKLVEMDRKRMEDARFMELQNQGASIMGYDAKKQAAKTYADFEMKSEFEKNQFAVEQGAQMFSA